MVEGCAKFVHSLACWDPLQALVHKSVLVGHCATKESQGPHERVLEKTTFYKEHVQRVFPSSSSYNTAFVIIRLEPLCIALKSRRALWLD